MLTTQYFAELNTKAIGKELKDRYERYFNFLASSGILNRMQYAHLHYHGMSPTSNASSHQIAPGGKQSQLAMMKVNHLRNLAQHLLQLTTSQKPAPQPIATNSDAKSQKQVTVAKGVLEYYGRELRIDELLDHAAEHAIVLSEGFIKTEWDTKAGTSLGFDEFGNEKFTGDVKCNVVLPTDVIRDPNKNNWDEIDWCIVRNWISKWEIVSQYGKKIPDSGSDTGFVYADDPITTAILAAQSRTTYDRTRISLISGFYRSSVYGESDDIAVYEFFHKKGPTHPDGRYVIFLQDGTVLFDGPLPYKEIPVRRICPGELIGSPYGYTPIFDLLVLQQAIDALYSAIVTNQMTFGVQVIMAMKGSNLDFKALARGLSFLEYASPENKPEPMNFTKTAPEIFSFIGQLEKAMETISGVNSVVRGNPEASLKSGSALALVQAQAIQFSSGLMRSYAHLVEDVYTDILNILKEYSKDAKMVTIVGKFNRSMMLEFQGEDISDINRVVVQSGNALEQTLPGRISIAQDLIQNKMITKPEEYLAVINTGRLDPMVEGDNSELMLIRSENEAMAAGQSVFTTPVDEHALHIKEHRCVLSTPEARENPQLIALVSQHMQEHVQALADPAMAQLLTILGQTPLMAAMMPEPGQGYAPGATPGPNNQHAPSSASGKPPENPQNPQPKQPELPKNPSTGEKWDPKTGGGQI